MTIRDLDGEIVNTPRPDPTPGRSLQTDTPRTYYGWMLVGIVISFPVAIVAWVWFIAQAVRLATVWGWLP